jgi:hypothetical protein
MSMTAKVVRSQNPGVSKLLEAYSQAILNSDY